MAAQADYRRLHSFLSPSRRSPEDRQEATKHINEPDVNEVLNIARNSLIGSSAVFAGLLAIPFAPNFKELEDASEQFYLFALVLQLAAVACFLSTSIISVIGGGNLRHQAFAGLPDTAISYSMCHHRECVLEACTASPLHWLWMLRMRAEHHSRCCHTVSAWQCNSIPSICPLPHHLGVCMGHPSLAQHCS